MATKKAGAPPKHYSVAYWVDETVPDLSDLLPEGVDPVEFSAWLGRKLGDFRGARAIREASPTRVEEVDVLHTLRSNVRSVYAGLHFLAIPPIAKAHLQDLALKVGLNWLELTERATADLLHIEALITSVERDLRALPSRPGRKTARARDVLLAQVADRLQLPTKKARADAVKILNRCGISISDNINTEKSAARRGKK